MSARKNNIDIYLIPHKQASLAYFYTAQTGCHKQTRTFFSNSHYYYSHRAQRHMNQSRQFPQTFAFFPKLLCAVKLIADETKSV